MSSEGDLFRALAQPSYEEMLAILMEQVSDTASIHPTSEWRHEINVILRKHHWHWFDFWDAHRFAQTRIPHRI